MQESNLRSSEALHRWLLHLPALRGHEASPCCHSMRLAQFCFQKKVQSLQFHTVPLAYPRFGLQDCCRPSHRRQVITRLCLLVSKFVPLTAQHAPRHAVLGEWASYQYRPPVDVSLLWLVQHPAAMSAHPTRGALILANRSMPNHTPSLDYCYTPIQAAGHPVRPGSCVGASDVLPPPAPPASPFRHALATSCAVVASP